MTADLDLEFSGQHLDTTGLLVRFDCRGCGVEGVSIGRLVQCLLCGSTEVSNQEN